MPFLCSKQVAVLKIFKCGKAYSDNMHLIPEWNSPLWISKVSDDLNHMPIHQFTPWEKSCSSLEHMLPRSLKPGNFWSNPYLHHKWPQEPLIVCNMCCTSFDINIITFENSTIGILKIKECWYFRMHISFLNKLKFITCQFLRNAVKSVQHISITNSL